MSTTNAKGAQCFLPELVTELTGRNVVGEVDRDAAGYQRARTIFDQLRLRARRYTLLLPATTAAKSDLTDHVDAGLWQPTHPFGGLTVISRGDLQSGP